MEDAGSKNKLILDGTRVDTVDLRPGVIVQVGKVFLTMEEASSGEFDLAVRARTPDPDLIARRTDDTEDSAGAAGGAGGPAAGLRVIRAVEKSGRVDGVLPEVLEILQLQGLLVFELGPGGECAISRTVGRLPDEATLDAIEISLMTLPDQTPTRLPLSPKLAAVAYRSCEGHPDRSVVGLRISREPMDSWERDLFEYISMRTMGSIGSTDHSRADLRRSRLSLPHGTIIGESAAFRSLVGQLEAVVDTRLDVLLIGETGTGKELLARTLHESGPTSSGPFIAINCAAIPTELLEAELFGVKGRVATGVDPRVGLFLDADGGSIFLDEIGELAEPLQAKLLRVLQEREVLPIGGTTPRKINVRVIAASNRDLLVLAEQGRFRRDLYYRMSGLLVRVPSLRERKDDIPALALGFLEKSAREHHKSIIGISRKAMSLLLDHDWPGNVRELQNEVARAVLFSHDRGVRHSEQFETVAKAVVAHRSSGAPDVLHETPSVQVPDDEPVTDDMTLQDRVDAVEKDAILRAMTAAGGNKSQAARRLGITRNGLAMKMKRLGL
jgi:two-component system response regulator HydG